MFFNSNSTVNRILINLIKSKLVILSKLVGTSSPNFILITFLTIGFIPTYAQTTETDSLRNALSITIKDAERISLMNELSSKLQDIDAKQALFYVQKALKLARQTNDKEKEIKAIHNLGMLMYDSPKKDSALVYFINGERMARERGLKKIQADYLMSLANWFRYHQVDSTKTVNYLLKSVEVSKEANYTYGIARSYAKLASFYTRYKQIQLSEAYLNLSAEYYIQIEKGGEEIAHYYDEVGNKIWDYNPKKSMDLYFKGLKFSDTYPNIKVSLAKAHSTIGKPEIALEYLKDAMSNLDSRQYNRMTGIATAQLAEVYLQLGDYKAALKTCNEGIAFLSALSMSNRSGLPAMYRTKGLLMELNGNDKAALEFYTKSLEEADRINEIFELVKSNVALGNFYSAKAPQKGEKYCEIALKHAKENNFTSLEITACECLFKIFKAEKNYSKSLKYFERKVLLSDSLGTLKVEHALDINSKIAQKDKQLAQESYLKEIKEEQLRNQYRTITILAVASLFGLLLIGILFFSIKRISNQNFEITRKTNELETANKNLGQSNEELERFAYVASHDLKSPLNNIIMFTGLLRRTLEKEASDSVKQSLGFIESSGKRMSNLIDDILEYSKLSSQNTSESKQKVVKLNELVNEISQLVRNNPDGKLVNIEATALPNLKWNSSKIFLLFKNLIENGLKYNKSENPTVKLYFSNTAGINSVYIEDNGIGIKQEYFDKIFVMFQRLHNQSEYDGTGLGLATCKKIVDEFNGKITISSTLNKGTIFKIEIPEDIIYHDADTV